MTITETLRRLPVVIAHRGDHRVYPENTLKAFARALQAGHCVECDVRFTCEGEAVIVHDELLDATTDIGARFPGLAGSRVEELPSDTVRSLNAVHPASGRRDPVPALEALLRLLKQQGGCADIEIKYAKAHDEAWVVAHLLEAVRRFGLERQVMISSFHHPYIALLKQACPEIFTALLFDALPDTALETVRASGADGCFAEERSMATPTLGRLHDAGIMTGAYTVNDPKRIDELVRMGVGVIFTDDIGAVAL